MKKKIQQIFSILEIKIISFEMVPWKTNFYRERILVIGSQYVNKLSQYLSYYLDRVFETDVLSELSKNMAKLLPCRFQCFVPFNILTVHKCSDTGLFRHLRTTFLAVYNFVNTSAVRRNFSANCSKLYV